MEVTILSSSIVLLGDGLNDYIHLVSKLVNLYYSDIR